MICDNLHGREERKSSVEKSCTFCVFFCSNLFPQPRMKCGSILYFQHMLLWTFFKCNVTFGFGLTSDVLYGFWTSTMDHLIPGKLREMVFEWDSECDVLYSFIASLFNLSSLQLIGPDCLCLLSSYSSQPAGGTRHSYSHSGSTVLVSFIIHHQSAVEPA